MLAAIIFGIFLGLFSRTLHDIYVDYRSAEGLIAASGRPVGGDFVCFYIAGQAAAEDPSKLYDWQDARKRQRALLNAPVGKEWILPYAYPPLFALLLIPFGKLSFLPANLAWIGFSLTLAFLSVFFVLSQSRFDRRQRIYASLSLLAFTPFTLDCLAGGQTSAIGMLIVAGIYYLTKKGKEFFAGLVLGLGYYKPPLFFFLALTFLLQKRWRLIGGALLSSLALVLMSVIYLGPTGFMDCLEKMARYLYGREVLPGLSLPTAKGVGLLSFLVTNLSGKAAIAWSLYLAVLFLALLLYSTALSKSDPQDEKGGAYDIFFSLAATLSLFLSAYMLKYDASIFFIAALIAIEPLSRLPNKPTAHIAFALSLLSFLSPLIDQIGFAGIAVNAIMLLMISWIIFLFYLVKNEFIMDNLRL